MSALTDRQGLLGKLEQRHGGDPRETVTQRLRGHVNLQVLTQSLMNVGGGQKHAISIFSQRLRVKWASEVQLIRRSYHLVTPRGALLHDDVGANWPMVLAVTLIDEIRPAEVGANNEQNAVSEAQFFCCIPKKV